MAFSDISTVLDLGGQDIYCNTLRVGVPKPDQVGPYNKFSIGTVPAIPTTVNVLSQGVRGDGITDDYLAINAAINAMSVAGGGTLYFPAGTYFTSLAIQPASGVNLQG